METENKTCENCKYGKEHYILGFNGLFLKTKYMHCANGKVTDKQFERRHNGKEDCIYWLPFELQVENAEQKIKCLLTRMNTQLENALQAIKHYDLEDK